MLKKKILHPCVLVPTNLKMGRKRQYDDEEEFIQERYESVREKWFMFWRYEQIFISM